MHLQGYTIQGASLDFSINATVSSPAAGAANATDTAVVSLGPSTPVGLGAKASQRYQWQRCGGVHCTRWHTARGLGKANDHIAGRVAAVR